jgi:ankyrin repeat protein
MSGLELFEATREGDLEKVNSLIARGAPINWRNVQFNLNTAIFTGAHYGHYHVVKVLLEAGADFTIVSAENITPLWIASRFGYSDIVRLFLEHEDSKKILVNFPDFLMVRIRQVLRERQHFPSVLIMDMKILLNFFWIMELM